MDAVAPMGRSGDYHDHHSHPPPPPPMQHHQPGHFWYPPPPSSAPPGDHHFPQPHHLQQQQHPPPPPVPSSPFPGLPPPQYPHHQQPPPPPWAQLPDHLHLQHQYQPSNFPPHVPPPMGIHPGATAAAGSPHHHGVPPPNPPYPATRPLYPPPPPPPAHSLAPHAQPPPLPPSAMPHTYSHPSQTWGNQSWHATQSWDYTDPKFHYNNEEDWAARARAWAAANSSTESVTMQPQCIPSGTPNNYHDQYQHCAGPPFMASQHLSLATPDHHFPDSATDLHRRVNNSQEPSLNSVPYSVTNFHTYDARDEGLATDTGVTVSPPPRTVSSSTSVDVQEVPSSYSSFSGNTDAMDQFEKLNVPLHLSSPGVPIPGRLSTLSVNPISRELSHLPYRDLPIEYSDTGVRSQSIEQIPFDRGQIQNTVPANTDQGRAIDQSVPPSSVHGWAQAIAPGPLFPHVTPAPPGSQFDSSSISSSLPGHPAQVFGRNQGPNFQPGVSSVSAPFGFDTGSSLHPTSAFPMDANEAFNLSERPKKAAVPNWLRDEIIKKKSTVASSSHDHPNGDSSHSTVAEVHDKIFRKDELADSKSLDSTRSTEDEDDDEDDVDAVRSAAINQEIKRVLTDVLLKVTDELFEEIATKVLNEDELEVDHSTVVVKRKDSLSPPPSVTPKTSAKVMVPAASTAGKSGPVGHSTLASSGGDILGLANYASDDDYEENQGSSAPFSGKSHDSSDQCGARGVTSEDTLRQEKPSVQVAVEEPRGAPLEVESANKNSSGCNGALTDKSRLEVAHTENAVKSLESGSALERKVLAREKLDRESESAHGHSDNGNSNIGQVTESISKSGSGDVPQDRKGPLDRNFSKGVESVSARRKGIGEDSDAGNLKKRVDRDQMLEKIDERASSKPRSKDLSSKHSADLSESESRRTVYHGNDVDDKKGSGRDKKDRMKEVDHWKRERIRDEKEGRSRQATKDSYSRQKSRQTSSPSARCRNGGDNSLESPSSGSGEETSETSKKRKLQSSRHSLSPSPTRSRRQVLRSSHSKRTQHRHSPYSHMDARRRRRSRSSSLTQRKRSGHNRS